MVRAQKASNHHKELQRDKTKDGGVPNLESLAFEVQIPQFASGEGAAGIARLADRCLNERGEVAAAGEYILYA